MSFPTLLLGRRRDPQRNARIPGAPKKSPIRAGRSARDRQGVQDTASQVSTFKRIGNIRTNFEKKPTAELLTIWQENDRAEYSNEAFEALPGSSSGLGSCIEGVGFLVEPGLLWVRDEQAGFRAVFLGKFGMFSNSTERSLR